MKNAQNWIFVACFCIVVLHQCNASLGKARCEANKQLAYLATSASADFEKAKTTPYEKRNEIRGERIQEARKIGWDKLDVDYGPWNNYPVVYERYGNGIAWYGFGGGSSIGAFLTGAGNMSLEFGNCWKGGVVKAYLNTQPIHNGICEGNLSTPNITTINFPFMDGDYLELKEEDANSTEEAIIQLTNITVSNCQCDEREFMCQNGEKCLTRLEKCDGNHDCADKSDETNCTPQPCDPSNFYKNYDRGNYRTPPYWSTMWAGNFLDVFNDSDPTQWESLQRFTYLLNVTSVDVAPAVDCSRLDCVANFTVTDVKNNTVARTTVNVTGFHAKYTDREKLVTFKAFPDKRGLYSMFLKYFQNPEDLEKKRNMGSNGIWADSTVI